MLAAVRSRARSGSSARCSAVDSLRPGLGERRGGDDAAGAHHPRRLADRWHRVVGERERVEADDDIKRRSSNGSASRPPWTKVASGTRSAAIASSSGVMSRPVTAHPASAARRAAYPSRSRRPAARSPGRHRRRRAPAQTAARWRVQPVRPSRGSPAPVFSAHRAHSLLHTVPYLYRVCGARMTHPTDISLSEARALIARAIDKAAHIGARGAFAVVGAPACSCQPRAWIAAAPAGWPAPGPRRGSRPRSRSPAPSITCGWRRCRRRSPPASSRARRRRTSRARAACRSTTRPIRLAPVVGGFSASGATIGPFVNIPGVDRRMLIADGKPANSEDLIVLWALGLPYEGQHGDDREALARRLRGAARRATGLGYGDPPPAEPARAAWAVGLADQAIAEAGRRGVRIAVAVVDGRGDPIQQDTMDGAPTAAPFVAEAVAAGAATFQRPSTEIDPALITVLPYRVLTAARRTAGPRRRAGRGRPRYRRRPTSRVCQARSRASVLGVRICIVGCGAIGGLYRRAPRRAARHRGVGVRRRRRSRRGDQRRTACG